MEEKNIRILLQYDGTRYDGWQKQGNTQQTVQGKLEAVLSRLAGGPVEVHGSGRRMQVSMHWVRWLIFIFLCLLFAAVKQKLPI